MRQLYIVVLLMFNFIYLKAQDFTSWTEHLPYRKATHLVANNKNIFCLTQSGLFSYSLTDNEIVSYTKAKGLSDVNITAIGWSEEQNSLLLGYDNGNLDLIKDNEIINISEINKFSTIDNKTINSITVSGGFAYLGTDFGIVLLNIDKEEITDTYIIGAGGKRLKVNDVVLSSNEIWAASEEGIYNAMLNSTNLVDFNNWNLVTNISASNRECKDLEFIGNDLFVLRSTFGTTSEIYKLTNNIWSEFQSNTSQIYSIKNINNNLWLCQSDIIKELGVNGTQQSSITLNDNDDFRDVYQINDRVFIADYERSLIENQGSSYEVIKPDGPMRSDISSVHSVGDQTWAVAGNHDDLYQNVNTPAELFLFESKNWKNFTQENTEDLSGKFDLVDITSNQRNESRIYTASWGDGIFFFENQELKANWNSSNSPLDSKGVISMSSDSDGNLWVLDANSNDAIKVLSYEGEWNSIPYNSLSNQLDMQKIIALENGDKWVLRAVGKSLFAFNENGTIANKDDDVSASFSVRDENNSTITSQVYDLVEDKDGSVWLATSSGVVVYADPGTIFRNGDFYAYRPIITIEGSTQFLLSTEKVISITTNGANQKWLGTESSGAFLVSENGDEQLAHFNTNNSPLPSNKIDKISVNPGTGEVFFVTDKGLVSYRGKVTEGTDDYSDLYVYPNPVRETYKGDVTVSGLITDSTVKITDVSGNLVWEGKSEGGQFIWNGKNFNGSRVHTGVYLIFCSNSDGSKSKVIKLLFIH